MKKKENFQVEVEKSLTGIQNELNLLAGLADLRFEKRAVGVKDLIEKKEGLIRRNIMGKIVNYSARSVILPDPMIETGEIGVPLFIAMKLTYPVPVTNYNIKELTQYVINGPDQYPGANYILSKDEMGKEWLTSLEISKKQRVTLSKLLSIGQNTVLRHVKNGDIFLVNRQPTLHRNSMLGHKVRVLNKQKVLRLHYANCAGYYADFDGDEMNIHYPQNELARSEAYELCSTQHHYIVPTSGEPIRGLIQDILRVNGV